MVNNIGRRDEVVQRESRNIINDVINGPNFFHSCPAMLLGQLPKPENRGNGPSSMGNHHAVNISVVSNAASYADLPVHSFVFWGLYPREVGVLQVYKEATLLAEIAVKYMPDHLGGAFASFHYGCFISGYFEYKAVVVANSFLPQALGIGK